MLDKGLYNIELDFSLMQYFESENVHRNISDILFIFGGVGCCTSGWRSRWSSFFKYDFVMNIRALHQLIGECACHKNYKPGNVAHLYDLGDVESANIFKLWASSDINNLSQASSVFLSIPSES